MRLSQSRLSASTDDDIWAARHSLDLVSCHGVEVLSRFGLESQRCACDSPLQAEHDEQHVR
jgi:hypothetical protein